MGDDFRHIGRRVPRREDRRFLTGLGCYVDDIELPGCLHAHFVRSPHASARILEIDTRSACAQPGVVGVFTGRDLSQWVTPLRMAPPIDGLQPVEMLPFPVDHVRFQGDPVAVVVADDRYRAEDAAEWVEVRYEELPCVVDAALALDPAAPCVDPSLGSNLLSHQCAVFGDVPGEKARAFGVVERKFSQHRQTHAPVETRGCAAHWDAGREHLTFYVGSQVPHPYRTQLAARLRLTESQVTVHSPDVGGGFGQKIALYREELSVAALARHLRRPVRWREDRMENLVASTQSREDLCRTVASFDRDGRIRTLELEILEDFGAYCFYPGNYLARVVAMILTGPYRIEHYSYDVRVVLTNKVGNAPMRAPMAVTSWVIEGTMDAVAHALNLDPAEVRRRNLLREDELPFRMPTGEVLADVSTVQAFESALRAADYAGWRERQHAARAEGRYLGIGICNVIESTTYGSAFYKAAGIPGSGHEAAWIRIEPTGVVSASAGLGASGQGYETAFAQVVADGLGVLPASVRILLGNTDVAPYGMGSRGARGGTAGGGTLYLCARKARERVLGIAAHLLKLPEPGALRLRDGCFEQCANGQWEPARLTLADVARVAYLDPLALPAGIAPGLDFSLTYDPPPMTYSNSTHVCVLEVDDRTGRIRYRRYLVVEDCGTVLSPVVVEGQQHGAVAMGLSGATLEQVLYDESGQNLTATLADYRIASPLELPDIDVVPHHTPSRSTPAGIKGMAEGGVMGAIGAVANAVQDALLPLGVTVDAQPLTPMAIRALLRAVQR